MHSRPSLAVIACAVLEDEVRALAASRPQVRRIEVLPQGLHNEPLRLQRELQQAVERAEAEPTTEAIALVYGLCSRGVENLRHPRVPLVIARAHDCVTLFLGDKQRYAAYLQQHPGTYWYTPGWIKSATPPGPDRDARLRAEYAAKFEPEEVEYLMEMEQHWRANYSRATYVGLGTKETERDVAYTRHCAECLGWSFDRVQGDAALLEALLDGAWDEQRFLVVPPHHSIRLTADDTIVRAEPDATAPDVPPPPR
jgi:hypothetical protein